MAEGTTKTNYEEIQEMEISALRAIFMDNFEEKKSKGAWNKKADREFILNLQPLSAAENEDLAVDLHVTLPATYPKTPPICRVAYYGRIPAKSRTRISQILRDKPKELLGSEAIYELATLIQDTLEDALVTLTETEERPTLDQERTYREIEVQRLAEEDKLHQEEQQKLADDEEERLLAEMVEKERSRVAKLQEKSGRYSSDLVSEGKMKGDLTFDEDIRIRPPGKATSIFFRSIIKKTLYRRGPVTSVYTADPVQLGSEDSQEGRESVSLALKTCTLRAEKRLVHNLEAKLQKLVNLEAHANVLGTFAFRIIKEPQSPLDWSINILVPLAHNRSFRDLLQTIRRVDVSDMRPWLIQVLEGLLYLHQNHLVLGRLSVDNILLDINESGVSTVKISDAGFQYDLHMLYHGGSNKFSSAAASDWMAAESGGKGDAKPQPPQDIWDFGVFMLQSLFGLDVQRRYFSPANLIEDMNLAPSLSDLLQNVFRADAKKRPGAFDLLTKGFLRSDDPVEMLDPPQQELDSTMHSLVSTRSLRGRRESNVGATKESRYGNDFVELGRLGKGGFGEVVRARNKLDGTTYAIKKISQPSEGGLDGVLSEVMLLSRLNHPFIVRYYAVWVEESGSGGVLQTMESSGSESESPVSEVPRSNTLGLDFISSSGNYPKIEFALDSDDEDEATSEPDVESEAGSESTEDQEQPSRLNLHRRQSSVSVSSKVTLYIQMELCEKQTLRDVFHDLHGNPQECWRLFRQILDCLAYIHSNGILHRDLKPDNIFLTTDEGNLPRIKVGDFGLARLGESSARPKQQGFTDPELTLSIGTSLYVAPEVRSSGGGKYNDKADMYSLGIILFEMCYHLSTAMERVRTLEELHNPEFEFPSIFQEPEKQVQAEVIQMLVKPKPGDRPSSQELLRSGKIPSYVEDEAIRNALQSLSDKSSPMFTKMMGQLFLQMRKSIDPRDITYDLDLNLVSKSSDALLLESMLKTKLVSIFSRHGAVETKRQHLLPASEHYDSAACLLDSSGSVLQLPYDLTLPYARSVAKQAEVVGKSFTFGQVFRQAPAGTHPQGYGEVDFDIVTGDSLDLALREAEAIKVLDEVMDSVPSMAALPIVYYLTHSKLLDAILSFCGIALNQNIKQIISRLHIGTNTWGRIRNELRSANIGVASTSLDDLMRFDFREPYDIAIPKLRSLLDEGTEGLESTFRHLDAVTTYLDRFRVKRKILISPLSGVNEHFYRGGLLFQCVNDSKRRKVIGAGGRYDSLIQEYRTGSKLNRHGVGFNLAWDILVESMTQLVKPSSKQSVKKIEDDPVRSLWKPRRCDVLVDSIDASALRSSGIDIVQELWANEIGAELVIDAPEREQANYQNLMKDDQTSYHWSVLIKQDETLKVRNIARREDIELRRGELVPWLRSDARDRERTGASTAAARPGQHGGSHEGTGAYNDARIGDVQILVAQHRSKKTNRRNIVDDALARTASMNSSFLGAPIAAVELKDELFDAIRETRLADPESWRRCIQSAPLAERQYLGQLHALLLEHAGAKEGQGPRAVWLYNFRSRSCFLYDLGKESSK